MSRYWPRHFGAHANELGTTGDSGRSVGERARTAVEQFVAPPEQQVAEQEGGGLAEGGAFYGPAVRDVVSLEQAMGCRRAPTGVGIVHDVVVHQRGGVEELEGGGGHHHGVEIGGCLVSG